MIGFEYEKNVLKIMGNDKKKNYIGIGTFDIIKCELVALCCCCNNLRIVRWSSSK